MGTLVKQIGIITWRGWGNFGTSLQSFSLHKKLIDLGYNVYLVEQFSESSSLKKYVLRVIKSIYFLLGIDVVKNYQKQNYYNFKKFNNRNYNVCSVLTRRDYKALLSNTDVFITGSDQIWNAWHNYNPFYFLDFAKDKKRVAYASSIGTAEFPKSYVDEIKEHLGQFKYIGVRERSAVDYLKNLLNRNDILEVLDPTFLLTYEEWQEVVCDNVPRSIALDEPYILCYLIGQNQEYIKQLEEVKKTIGIKHIIIVPAFENPNIIFKGASIVKNIGPKEFVWLIMNASYVCTDSFHATALSINFSKDFVEFLRFSDCDIKSQNSRIYDLLNHYSLSYKIYSVNNSDWTNSIDYTKVQKSLASDRNDSLTFLINAIEY